MPVIGKDCHLTLCHPAVNEGQPFGFVLAPEGGSHPQGVLVTREAFSDEAAALGGEMRVWVEFDVVLGDSLALPDGSFSTARRAELYLLLMKYLSQKEGICLETAVGTFVNLGALGYTARENHFADRSLVSCQLNNVGVYFPPADPAVLSASIWDGLLGWDSAIWR